MKHLHLITDTAERNGVAEINCLIKFMAGYQICHKPSHAKYVPIWHLWIQFQFLKKALWLGELFAAILDLEVKENLVQIQIISLASTKSDSLLSNLFGFGCFFKF